MKTNRVRRLNIRDHSLTKLAEVAKEDVKYCRMIEHLKKGTNLARLKRTANSGSSGETSTILDC